MALQLRVKGPGGQSTLKLDGVLPWQEALAQIASAAGVPAERAKVLAGFPPKELAPASPTDPLSSLIKSGESLQVQDRGGGAAASAPPASSSAPATAAPAAPAPARAPAPAAALSAQEEECVVRRKVADDNSCLFSSVGYVLEGHDVTKAPQLRRLIANAVGADPEEYNEAVLGKTNAEYQKWILSPNSWGGAIELSILSRHYRTEIAAFDLISGTRVDLYGEGAGYNQRVMLLYDGIHYDALALAPFPDAPTFADQTGTSEPRPPRLIH
eukprot:tig00000282_g23843.t1